MNPVTKSPVSLRVAPFAALRPAAGRAAETITPPYDVVSVDEARARVAARPNDFLHLSLPEAAMAPETGVTAEERYTAARRSLDAFLVHGVIARDTKPAYYIYRVASGSHTPNRHCAAGVGGLLPGRHAPPPRIDPAGQGNRPCAAHTGAGSADRSGDAGASPACRSGCSD